VKLRFAIVLSKNFKMTKSQAVTSRELNCDRIKQFEYRYFFKYIEIKDA
jgi:hypothetical protein